MHSFVEVVAKSIKSRRYCDFRGCILSGERTVHSLRMGRLGADDGLSPGWQRRFVSAEHMNNRYRLTALDIHAVNKWFPIVAVLVQFVEEFQVATPSAIISGFLCAAQIDLIAEDQCMIYPLA